MSKFTEVNLFATVAPRSIRTTRFIAKPTRSHLGSIFRPSEKFFFFLLSCCLFQVTSLEAVCAVLCLALSLLQLMLALDNVRAPRRLCSPRLNTNTWLLVVAIIFINFQVYFGHCCIFLYL